MKVSKKRKIVFAGIILALAVFFSFYFDGVIVRAISSIRTDVLNEFFLGITFASSIIIVFIFLTAVFMKKGRRKYILPLWITLALSAIVSFILKISIQRHRPYQLGIVSVVQGLVKASHNIWDFSFPSFQAAMVFSAVPFLNKEFPKFKYVWLIFAVLVAFSRIYFGVHFLSDVIVGGTIGYIIGALLLRYKERK